MVPACCTASRRVPLILICVLLVMSSFPAFALSVLRYERSALLDIQASVNSVGCRHFQHDSDGHSFNFPELLWSIPPELSRLYGSSIFKKKRQKRRGKRSGRLVKNLRNAREICANNLDLRTWLLPVYPDQSAPVFRPLLRHRRTVNGQRYLKELKYSAIVHQQSTDHITVKAVLLNVRSVGNKTFILQDFIVSQNLDFLFLTETWLEPMDTCLLSELLPVNYNFLNTPSF